MDQLARSLTPRKLAANAYALYEKFRPAVPAGTRGWGARGELDLERLKALAGRQARSLTGLSVASGVPSVGAIALGSGPSCTARGRT